MNQPGNPDFWDRLAARTQPAGALATIESPRTISLLVAGALGGAAVFATVFSVVFFMAGEPLSGWATAALAAAYVVSWVWHAVTGQVTAVAYFALVASVANQLILHIGLGGFANSGAYLMWGISMTFALAMMLGRRPAMVVGSLYIAAAVSFAFLEESLAAGRPAPAPGLTATLFAVVMIGNLAMVTSVLMYFLARLALERERAERLLLNVLPAEVAAELKEFGRTTARRFDSISVLFADIVGFTERTLQLDPEEMVDQLNKVFSHFDDLADRYGCEKIRTIGDGYMVAAGVPVPRSDHAQALASMALDMLEYGEGTPMTFRIGINSGPAVAGVIGNRKFQYDVWGDTVNTASRMESHGAPGRIQISEATYSLIADRFICSPRGEIEVKGKGKLSTWLLEARRNASSSA